jgi:putative flavoprotein involved in K+ transport
MRPVSIECVVIGAGQAGLAMSRCLTDRKVDHVVLERGRLVERWRSERWDSLRLLTPNWQTRLPAFHYDGPDPDGYMTMPEVVNYFERYAASFRAPVELGVDVVDVFQDTDGFHISTTRGEWRARSVVVATGHSQRPAVPRLAAAVPASVAQITPTTYRRPDQLQDGGVLVVGASASGIQLADELLRAGHPVTIAVGQHTRLPRIYRGRDILWWLDQMGVFDETVAQVYDVEVSRDQPSLQLVGHPSRITLDLVRLRERDAVIAGRLSAIEDGVVHFADDLVATTAAADVKLASLLQRIDTFIRDKGIEAERPPRFVPYCFSFSRAPRTLDLAAAGVNTVIWATGFRREYPWLHVPVLDRDGEIRHTGGVTSVKGLFVLGLHFLRRRNSSFIDGVGADAAVLSDHIADLRHGSRRWNALGAA